MANSITANPLILDTAATITFNRPLLTKRIDWVGAATIGNTATVTDLPGNVRVTGVCGATLTTIPMWEGDGGRLTLKSPFVVSAIPSGKIVIWY